MVSEKWKSASVYCVLILKLSNEVTEVVERCDDITKLKGKVTGHVGGRMKRECSIKNAYLLFCT
jgi:hypothetical protein